MLQASHSMKRRGQSVMVKCEELPNYLDARYCGWVKSWKNLRIQSLLNERYLLTEDWARRSSKVLAMWPDSQLGHRWSEESLVHQKPVMYALMTAQMHCLKTAAWKRCQKHLVQGSIGGHCRLEYSFLDSAGRGLAEMERP